MLLLSVIDRLIAIKLNFMLLLSVICYLILINFTASSILRLQKKEMTLGLIKDLKQFLFPLGICTQYITSETTERQCHTKLYSSTEENLFGNKKAR